MNCPEDEQLKVFLDGRLPEEFCQKVESHLQTCFVCQAKLPTLNHINSSIITSIDLTGESQLEFFGESECAELEAFANELPKRDRSPNQRTTFIADPSDLNTGIPKTIGRYQVIKHIGSGSFGAVYLALDVQLDRHVAVKVAHSTRVTTPEDAERYQREAKLLAKMEHPNIVPVYDSGLTEDGLVFIVFRFIRGSNLSEMMKPERFPFEKAIQLTCTIASALQYMHSHGIVHRDIKPANVLIDQQGTPYLTDFGLAIRADEIVQGREIVGTLAYMSPEQLSGDGHLVGPRSDIFSLGVLLFELLTDQRPFQNRSPDQSISWMGDVPSPCDLEKSLPQAIGRICQKALQNRSSDRFASAREFARELEAAGDDSSEVVVANDVIAPVYRGLRAFHREDHEFFCKLIPGLRSSQGNPESVQFWINRIRGVEGESQPRVGVIYGTTGSGKSSLVNAAVLPKLAEDITVISIQASVSRTEVDLANSLKKVFLASEEIESLPEICRHIRMRQPPFANHRILIVIDQFEQWLHGRPIDLSAELVQALRQCDGESIQCLLIVRDDFWVELSKFMRTVEEPMREGENMMAVEPFSPAHAEDVLQQIGLAVKGETSESEPRNRFIKRGVELIQTEGTVPPVRLALFVEITKDLPWTPETIRHFDDLKVLAQTYIKQRFDPELCPRRFRPHTTAMKAVLAALLPERGNDLKGQGLSLDELKTACGCENSPERFKQMIDLMDRDLRIISPVQQSDDHDSSVISYQLTHDYLVPAIRSWIDEEELRTFQGRAKLKLKERASLWNLKPESRQLPGFLEFVQIFTGTKSSHWTPDQSDMMKSAGKVLFTKAVGLAAIILIVIGIYNFQSQSQNDRALVRQLTQSRYTEIPAILERIEVRQPDIRSVLEEFRQSDSEDSSKVKRINLAMLGFDQRARSELKEQLLKLDDIEFRVTVGQFKRHKINVSNYQSIIEDELASPEDKFLAASALFMTDAEYRNNPDINKAVSHGLLKQPVESVIAWSEWLHPYRDELTEEIGKSFEGKSHPLVAANAARALSVFQMGQSVAYAELVLNSNAEQLSVLCQQASNQVTVESLLEELHSHERTLADDRSEKMVNCVAALSHFGELNEVSAYLAQDSNPSLRYRIIERIALSECSPATVFEALRSSSDEGVIAAMLLILGTCDETKFSDELKNRVAEYAASLYQEHPNAEVHSGCDWVLRRFGVKPELPTSASQATGNKAWFHTPQGVIMIIPSVEHRKFLPPLENNYEVDPYVKVDWSYAIAATEVTVEQYQKFDPNFRFISDLHSSLNSPADGILFESAMLYCNWLSRQEGYSEKDLCYEEKEGRARPKKNILECGGYRLPFMEEWIVACRAGTATPFPFGDEVKLLDSFAWHIANSESKLHNVGLLKPNQLGLFDICGNVSEFCHDPASLKRTTREWVFPSAAPCAGGSFKSNYNVPRPHGSLRVYDIPENSRGSKYTGIGFRIARSFQAFEK